MSQGWMIEADLYNTDFGDTTCEGQRSRGYSSEPNDDDQWTPFRLLDADGEVYFTGRSADIGKDAEFAFSPLDYFGSKFGCVTLEYWSEGKWVEL